jgi:hypothetical protein
MDLHCNEKRTRSTSSKGSVARSKEKEVKVYHHRSVHEREAAESKREATMKKKEIEAVEGIKQLAEKATWCNLATYVLCCLFLVKMKRGLDTLARRIGYGTHF